MSIKKIVFSFAVLAVFLGLTVSPASAQTVDINTLLQQIAALQAQIASLSGAPTGAPAGVCNFSRNLSMGSTGDDVKCLQTYLKSTGDFPAGTATTLYFGPTTKASVIKWQAANSVAPASGLFGMISQTKYYSLVGPTGPIGPGPITTGPCTGGALFNSVTGASCTAPTTLPAGCTTTTGFSPTTGLSCGSVVTVLPAGCTSAVGYSVTTGLSCAGGTTTVTPTGANGVLISPTISLESSPSDGTDVKIGSDKNNLIKWKVKISNDDGIIKQWGIKTAIRPWLYWKNARLMVGDTVIAEKTGLTSSDFQEVTTGSEYRLVFANLNYAVSKDASVYIVLQIDAVNDTSRAALSGNVIDQASNSVVFADANDDYTASDGVTSDRTWDFVAASTGNAVPSNSTATPGSRWTKVSSTGTTPNVTMQVFNVKAENRDIEINSVIAGASTSGVTVAGLTDSFDLYEGSCPTDGSITGCTLLGGGTVASGGTGGSTITFSSLNVPISAGTSKSFTLKALFADESDFTASMDDAASTTVFANASFVTGVDKPNFNAITVSGSNVTSGDVHAILVSPTLSNTTHKVTILGSDYQAETQFTFKLKADGGALYVSDTVTTALATSSTATTTAANNAITNITADTCSSCGDQTTYWVIPDGIERTFTLVGQLSNQNGGPGNKDFKITKIYFDDDTTDLNEFYFDTTFSGMSGLTVDVFLNNVDVN